MNDIQKYHKNEIFVELQAILHNFMDGYSNIVLAIRIEQPIAIILRPKN